MDSLQGYASDSDSESASQQQQQQHTAPATHTTAAADKPIPSAHDDQDPDYDPSDAFGLSSIANEQAPQVSTPAPAAAAAGVARDAPPSKRRRGPPPAATAHPSSASTSSSTAPPPPPPLTSSSAALTLAAPEVIDNTASTTALLTRPTDTTMHVNIPYKDMTAPVLGPQNPFASEAQRRLGAQQNTLSGHVEAAAISDYDFRNQQRTFDVQGYARNPSLLGGGVAQGGWVGDVGAVAQADGATAFELRGGGKEGRAAAKELRKKRKGQSGDPSIVEGEGAYVGPWGGWSGEKVHVEGGVGPTEAELARAEELSSNRKIEKEKAEAKRLQDEEAGTEKSIFHGKSMYDYQGRTYMHIPTDVDVNLAGEPGATESYLPKTCVHTFTGHTKGISALRLFPQSGHLMLSASMDTKIKLWDVYHEGSCLRTFMGHSKAVRDICFSNDGRRFLSAGYDRQIKLWDTETGACLQAFSNGKVPYCVKFHPDDDKQNTFLAGMSDKKIIQVRVRGSSRLACRSAGNRR
ncbi:related to CDC40 - Pre-mRNA splicing factor important for catalytic step II [Pseudozyma flocculosa]|uniref:Related to CDC40 - Pre-mRNA splicing factor important for catalytic step II n=1 Tax=Pseudozyma flocculosa TaxID=84751 RepID=A0A5C3FDU7_9BASI|nr:related to CDC40 - Pre-mRNA splicing factor important for catalytic step II [Pseudozyma flocculosa]